MKNYLWNKWKEGFVLEGKDCSLIKSEFEMVLEYYSQSHRHYHALSHLKQIFKLYDHLNFSEPNIILAVFFHDSVYNPRSKLNEMRSAWVAQRSLVKLGISNVRINKIMEMIMATATHTDRKGAPLTPIFLDLDFSILGMPNCVYQDYTVDVKKEYSWMSETMFQKAREIFLNNLLNTNQIFKTELLEEMFESQARKNIKRELGKLKSRVGN